MKHIVKYWGKGYEVLWETVEDANSYLELMERHRKILKERSDVERIYILNAESGFLEGAIYPFRQKTCPYCTRTVIQ